eukprot:TRINITY_DN23935_c0_g1_i1.p1 TRINITY_DN23935_c0_g1~~TRINITY_DN23935_c0_g1_i1.p1  ORF type:complete len:329 (+),score=45.82 TRINITY_DN23935_c0_g1_i1:79-1065(+)
MGRDRDAGAGAGHLLMATAWNLVVYWRGGSSLQCDYMICTPCEKSKGPVDVEIIKTAASDTPVQVEEIGADVLDEHSSIDSPIGADVPRTPDDVGGSQGAAEETSESEPDCASPSVRPGSEFQGEQAALGSAARLSLSNVGCDDGMPDWQEPSSVRQKRVPNDQEEHRSPFLPGTTILDPSTGAFNPVHSWENVVPLDPPTAIGDEPEGGEASESKPSLPLPAARSMEATTAPSEAASPCKRDTSRPSPRASALRSPTGNKRSRGNVKIGVTDRVYYAAGRQRPPPAPRLRPAVVGQLSDSDGEKYSTPGDIDWHLLPGGFSGPKVSA